MENLLIAESNGTFFIPGIDFNATTGKFTMTGESYLENTTEFYNKIYSWLENYFLSKKPIEFECKLSYFNTSSSKGILNLLALLKKYQDEGNEVEVTWYLEPDDIGMREDVEDFRDATGLDIQIVLK